MQLAGMACSNVKRNDLVRVGCDGLAREVRLIDGIGGGDAGFVEVELAAIVCDGPVVGEVDAEVAERLLGFGE
jgi:hypothetical protein